MQARTIPKVCLRSVLASSRDGPTLKALKRVARGKSALGGRHPGLWSIANNTNPVRVPHRARIGQPFGIAVRRGHARSCGLDRGTRHNHDTRYTSSCAIPSGLNVVPCRVTQGGIRLWRTDPGIGIGAGLAARPLPHHRAYGSVHGGSVGYVSLHDTGRSVSYAAVGASAPCR